MAEHVKTPPTRPRGKAAARSPRRRFDDVEEFIRPVGGGRRLPPDVERLAAEQMDAGRLERSDLTAVRLHSDWFAHELTEALDAEAVTHGTDVYLSADASDPSTAAGRMLLVHELFHAGHPHATAPDQEEAAAAHAGQAAIRSDSAAEAVAAPAPEDRGVRAGRAALGRLGRKAKSTLSRASSNGAGPIPDVLSAGEALVRLVGRLFERDPDDRGGRLTTVLARLEPRLRADVVGEVADRSGGHARDQLHELALQRPPEDGGHTEGEHGDTDVDTSSAATGVPEMDGSEKSVATSTTAATATTATSVEGHVRTAQTAVGTTSDASAITPEAGQQAAVADHELPDQALVDEQPPNPSTLEAGAALGDEAASSASAPAPASGPEAKSAAAPAVPSEDTPATIAAEPAPNGLFQMVSEVPIDSSVDAAPGDAADIGAMVSETETGDASGTTAGSDFADAESYAGGVDSAEGALGTVPTTEPGVAAPTSENETAPLEPEIDSLDPGPEPSTDSPADQRTDDAGPDATEVTGIPNPPAEEPEEQGATTATGEPVPSSFEIGGPEPGPAGVDAAPTDAEGSPADPALLDPGDIAAAAGIDPPAGGGEMSDPSVPRGGGGGGSAIADPPEPQAPDVSGMKPAGAMSAIAGLPATKLAASLAMVSGATTRELGDENAGLAANPPSMGRPSGVPADRDASLPPASLPPLPAAQTHSVETLTAGPGSEPPTAVDPPAPGAPVTLRVPDATVPGDKQITAEDAQRIKTAVRSLPTTDPALAVDAGPVPELELTGGEDPQQVDEQAASVEQTTQDVQAEGLNDARADMGENEVFPHVPAESISADLGGAAAGGQPASAATAVVDGAGAAGTTSGPTPSGGGVQGGGAERGEVSPAAVDAIAAEKSGAQMVSSARDGSTALGAARSGHDTDVEKARADTDRQINDEIAANGSEQTDARRGVRKDVGERRKDWVGEQNRIADDSRDAAGKATKDATATVWDARTKARVDAAGAIKTGNADIAKERSKAEESALRERQKAEEESDDGGFFSWVASKVKSFINKVKQAIHAVFELARKAVDLAISAAQKLAVAAIELGRKAVVGAIDMAGKALMAAGDIALAAFPGARDKFRKKIQGKVDGAKKAVNELADKLKAGVKKLLDVLGSVLKGALTLLEKAYTAAIDVVGKVVDSAIKAAKAFIGTLLDFAAIVSDVAADPIAWLRNLAAGFMDGVRNHVWPALLGAVKNWFKEKVEEVVGVGKVVLDWVRKGGITFADVVTMAWTAIKESLPGIIIQLLIEKLVALLIPAGGAVSLIIDGVRAAWGAASKILAAFRKFIAFLKSVKGGKSGPLFGALVGAAAVAVMDFVANFVLIRLKGAGQKVGGTLRKIADRVMKAVKKVGKAVKTGAKAAVGAVKRGAQAAGRAVSKVLPKGALKAGAKAIRTVTSAVRSGVAKVKAGYAKAKKKFFGKKKPQKPKMTVEQRIEATRKKFTELLTRGIGTPALWGWSKYLAFKYRWKRLRTSKGKRGAFELRGDINPADLLLAKGAAIPEPGNLFVSRVDRGETVNTANFKDSSFQAKRESEKYEFATTPNLVVPLLKSEYGLPITVTDPGMPRKRTSAARIAVDVQKRNLMGGGMFGSAVPDVQAVVPGLRTTASGDVVREKKHDTLYVFEPTLNENFLEGVGKDWQINATKTAQVFEAFEKLFDQYPDISTVVYTIVSPHAASQDVLDYLSARQKAITASPKAAGKVLHVVWRKVGK